jgi:hypothetical protein
MKIVATYSNLGEAGFAQSLLVGDGIAAELQNVESSVNLVGGPPSFNVVVPDSDEERARAAVKALVFSVPREARPARTPPSAREIQVFSAVVKAIGVYQLVVGVTYLVTVFFVSADLRHPSSTVSQTEYVLWFVFHIGVGLALLWGTESFCRLALLALPKSSKK